MPGRRFPPRAPRPLTRNQELVLEVLSAERRAMTAYQILDALRGRGLKAPVQVYRALDKLLAREEIHRIESLNAFVACHHRNHRDTPAFAICDDCHTIWEFSLPREAGIHAKAESKGFKTERMTIELHGCCAACDPNWKDWRGE